MCCGPRCEQTNKTIDEKYGNFRWFQHLKKHFEASISCMVSDPNDPLETLIRSASNSSHFNRLLRYSRYLLVPIPSALTREPTLRLRNVSFFVEEWKKSKEPAKTDNKNWLCMLRARDHKKGQQRKEREENGHETRIRLRKMCTFAVLHFIRAHKKGLAWEVQDTKAFHQRFEDDTSLAFVDFFHVQHLCDWRDSKISQKLMK